MGSVKIRTQERKMTKTVSSNSARWNCGEVVQELTWAQLNQMKDSKNAIPNNFKVSFTGDIRQNPPSKITDIKNAS